MVTLVPPLRPAMPDDAHALAELVVMAGEGLPLYAWRAMAAAGEDPWEVGRRRARRDGGGFSYRNAVVAEADGRVAAGLIGYPIPDVPEPVDPAAVPPIFAALLALESEAPGTWYVNVLATYPEHRGRGHGTRLLEVAERLAAETARAGLSLIVADANQGARRLYERFGFREEASRPMVKDGWDGRGENWLLMLRPF